jgi:hypothetical protein
MDLSSNSDFLAQSAHVGWGAALAAMLGPYAGYTVAALIVLGFAAAKEAAESIWGIWEPKQPWRSGAIDFAWWCAGILIAFIAK